MNAGTTYTPPLSGTDAASGPVSAASAIMPRPSRSHWTAAPVTKIAPSIAYVTSSLAPSDHATVVSRPSTGSGSFGPMFVSTNEPVPYVFFVMPGSTHAWPNSAACWSPAMPLTGTARPAARSARVIPKRPLDGATAGRQPSGRRTASASSVDHSRGADVVEHRAARVRRIGRVHAAVDTAGEVPEDPRVDGAEHEVGVGRSTPPSSRSHAELGRREVGIEHEAGPRAGSAVRGRRRATRRTRRRCAGPATRSRGAAGDRCAGPTPRRSRAGS